MLLLNKAYGHCKSCFYNNAALEKVNDMSAPEVPSLIAVYSLLRDWNRSMAQTALEEEFRADYFEKHIAKQASVLCRECDYKAPRIAERVAEWKP